MWKDLWFGAKELPFWAFSIRAILLYIALIITTRYMRQRQLSILSGHNYLVAAGIASLAAVRMVNAEVRQMFTEMRDGKMQQVTQL
jgi:uncharacterized membrane protein YcaP (DUF421 family)